MSNERLPLFRTEALEASRPKAYGRVVLIQPLSFTLLTAAACLIAVTIVGFFIWGRYTQHTTLVGRLMPTTGFIEVHAPRTGTIVEQRVSEGSSVKRDQVLYLLESDPYSDSRGAAKKVTAENEARRVIEIRAPASGTATAVVGEVGKTVDQFRPLLSIVPENAELEAQLLAPNRSVVFFQTGSDVMLRYDAYPYQHFGQHRGVLRSISRSPVAVADPGNAKYGRGSEPLYLIRVALPSQTVTAYGEPRKLQAGMTVQADILQDTKRLYEWILEPVYSITGKLPAESNSRKASFR